MQRLLATSVFLVLVSMLSVQGEGEPITYHFIDYPVNQADASDAGTDTISGTIITDGTLGAWTGHIIGGTLTFTSPFVSYTYPFYEAAYDGQGIMATSTQLLVPRGSAVIFRFGVTLDFFAQLEYQNNLVYAPGYLYAGFLFRDQPGPTLDDGWFRAVNPPATPGSIAWNDPRVIATVVPEPSAIVLLGIGVIGLTGYGWRCRRTSAT